MKSGFARRLFSLAASVSVATLPMLDTRIATRASSTMPEPGVIRATPAAPIFAHEERVAELAARRARIAERIGKKSILVMFSAEPRVYTNDVDYELRQENNLFYLTHLKQGGAKLVLVPGSEGAKEILFLPKRNPAAETWTGYMYSAEEARRISGINEIWEAKEFEPFMTAVRTRRNYRPQSSGVLLSASPAVAQSVTPPVPKGEQTVASASATAPAGAGVTPTTLVTQSPNPSNAVGQPVGSSTRGATDSNAAASPLASLYTAMAQNEGELFLVLPGGNDNREFEQEQKFAGDWAKAATGLNVRSAWPIFVEMRMRKSPSELRLLQHAIDISIEGHQRAQAVAPTAKWEYEVEAEIDYTYRRRNADNWGYPNIVGCGPNATTLHYQESQGAVRDGELILIDSGAEYEHYTADVTRTFPARGKFTAAQAEIYNIVLAAQEASFRAIKPGATLGEVHNASVEVIKDGLLRLGLITDRNSDQYRMWFMHGTSHWLGMNVHDVGTRGAKLDANMVFTVEPGIYIRVDALDYLPDTPANQKLLAAIRPAFEKYRGIGVRIEDDVVVTADGYKNLSAALPRTASDIEAFMAKAQREVRAHAWNGSWKVLPRSAFEHLGFGVTGSQGVTKRRRVFVGSPTADKHEHKHNEGG